ncbi:indolepyruvate ferredoxin oxidoreductase [Pseudovibrio axinellae]|uniref:Indolepyruvate ferredoxin oxidoreductase n=1 Tax=Pseudovibrio axinellae TaxID=989403 RepID=A0A165SYX5_9HYPH|nr:indolepyruvate ferredoxin oxidoreductase subunit alpha [Pseudovibrio axinellae]KZL05045.1 indolepyruvate ferredoxin oxidoreductase [Pseudovibrio axinellae]SER65821.1 indolepyruvate ferredoxin oxidoreductase alpha subunit [Pseudovibrio axinellae]
MAERSFAREVEKLRLGEGETFSGEGILAITKALLENGVGYVGGYQGSPISHLMDVLADAQSILGELGVHFEASASEATATAMLAASVHYPIRGAVTYKSVVGTNVASDALSNLASGGVTGGSLIIVGEDYGEGSSIMQERTYAFAMKSQVWMLDPRPNLPSIVQSVGQGFELSEASNTPVMLQVRIRSCHVHGHFTASNNKRPNMSVSEALENPKRDLNRIVLPPATYLHEDEKLTKRWPAAEKYILENNLNEEFGDPAGKVGLIIQGGNYNTVIRALNRLELANIYGDTDVHILCLNAVYPLCESQILSFSEGKDAIFVIEEGQPNFMEQSIGHMLYKNGSKTKLEGKGMLPLGGELTGQVVLDGLASFFKAHVPGLLPASKGAHNEPELKMPDLSKILPPRPPGFCTGCPERPIFAATKLVEQELGKHHIASDIGCHLFSIMPPFDLGATTMGYGLGPASASAFHNENKDGRKSISFVGDGGFWHNGVASSIGNAVFNKNDGVIVIVDNYYSAATGGQDILSSRANNKTKQTQNSITKAVQGMGVKWVRQLDRTYDVTKMRDTLKEALSSQEEGPKVIVASSECMLNKQRRVKPQLAKDVKEGRRVERPRFGVDEDVCTGDHACMRLSGCPSLSVKDTGDPLRDDPVAAIDQTCVGCGNCGEVADAAVLCPSFYEARVVSNPTGAERRRANRANKIMSWLQKRRYAQQVVLS